jgi:hypothetical protein
MMARALVNLQQGEGELWGGCVWMVILEEDRNWLTNMSVSRVSMRCVKLKMTNFYLKSFNISPILKLIFKYYV